MSDTPRTDAEVEIFNTEYTGFKDVGYVHETFARQLERELNRALEDARCAWATTRASDAARLEEMRKRDELQTQLDSLRKQLP